MDQIAKLDYTVEELKSSPQFDILTYAQAVKYLAQDIEANFDIPWLVPTIQSAHESRNGNSGLARDHCNLFGITATQSWKAKGKPVADMPTFEYVGSKRIDVHREFRKYLSWRESFLDWAVLISSLSIYKAAYGLFQDKRVVEGIREMAKIYATDPMYAQALVAKYTSLAEATKTW